jgi:hypothetical protein
VFRRKDGTGLPNLNPLGPKTDAALIPLNIVLCKPSELSLEREEKLAIVGTEAVNFKEFAGLHDLMCLDNCMEVFGTSLKIARAAWCKQL